MIVILFYCLMGFFDICICDFGNVKVGVINFVYISICINYVIFFYFYFYVWIWKI